MSYSRTLPNKHMEKIVETIAKFNISALLVIGGFEVENKTQPFKEPELNYFYINLQCQCYIKVVFNLPLGDFQRGTKVYCSCLKPGVATMSSASPCV